MAPTGDWDRDEIFERIPWEHISRDFSRFQPSPRVWIAAGMGLVLVVAVFLFVGRSEPVIAEEAGAVVTVAPTVPPLVTAPEVVTAPLSEADLFTTPPGGGELLAMTLAKTHARAELSSDTLYVDWVEAFGITSNGGEFSVELLVGMLSVTDGAYETLSPIALEVGVKGEQILWLSPIDAPSPVLDEAGESGEASPEVMERFRVSVEPWGELVSVERVWFRGTLLWGLATVESDSGALIQMDVALGSDR